MMKLAALLIAVIGLLSACVAYDPAYGDGRGYRGRDGVPMRVDRDRDGVPDRADRDRDGDGVPNRMDRRPDDPRRY